MGISAAIVPRHFIVPRGADRPWASPSASATRSRFASSCIFAALVVLKLLAALRGSWLPHALKRLLATYRSSNLYRIGITLG